MNIYLEKMLNIFSTCVNKNPDKIAIKNDKISYTYKEVDELSDIVCNNLKMTYSNNNIYAICSEKTPDFIVTILGLWKAQCAYIPIDTDFPLERVRYIIENSKIANIITTKNCIDKFENISNMIDMETLFEVNSKTTTTNVENDLAYVIYTSGSTGNPKGVQITYENLLNFFVEITKALPVNEKDILLSVTTISFDISIMEMFWPLMFGATIITGTKRMLIDMEKLKKAIIQNNITILQATPVTWTMLTAKGWKNENNIKVFCGGEKLEKQLAEKLLEVSNNVWNLYGPTEATIWSSVQKIDNSEDISIGTPLNNINYYIFDDEMNFAEEGELYIGGKCVAKGYFNNDVLTKERFIENPFDKNEIVYKTGDIVTKRNGNFYYVGRNDFQIKLNGHRIELEEIENSLKSIEEIRDAVVIPNQSNKSIVAFVILNKPVENLIEHINEYLVQRLPKYMIPHFVECVESFPTTFNNKIDRKSLLARHTLKKQTLKDKKSVLIKIWEKYLKREVTENTPFDICALDSLDFVQLCVEMNNAGVDVTLSQLFEYKTINNILSEISPDIKNDTFEKISMNDKLCRKLENRITNLEKVKIVELNEIENTMLMYYLFNRKSNIFYESYNYRISNKISNDLIIDSFYKIFSTVDSLKSLYYFNIENKNVKVFSEELKLIKNNVIKCTSRKEYDEYIVNKENEIYDINEFSIEINIVEFEEEKTLIINYHHIRLDGNRFYEKIEEFLNEIYKKIEVRENEKAFVPNENSIIIKEVEYLRKYSLKENVRFGTLVQYIVSKVITNILGYNSYDIVINNVPRKSDNDLSIKKMEICSELNEYKEQIDNLISGKLEECANTNFREHNILIIINNKQKMYEILKENSIVEKHVERNNYKIVFTIDIQEELQISVVSQKDDINILEGVEREIHKLMEENV